MSASGSWSSAARSSAVSSGSDEWSSSRICGREARINYVEQNRVGDHQWYISSMAKFEAHYPDWKLTYDVPAILREIYEANVDKWTPDSRA